MSRLDEFLPEYEVRERHERRVSAPPETAVAAALGTPGVPARLPRLRGRGGPVLGAGPRALAQSGRARARLTAVGLACLSAALFGAMSVGLRIGMNRNPDVELATVATVIGALAVALVSAAAEAPARGVHAGQAWPFLLAGLLQPGIGQLLVTLAIREAGASRASG